MTDSHPIAQAKPASPYIGDVMASLVLFIIAVPLSLGIAMASGTPAASAIVAIVVGALVVGSIAGAPLVVSGPAAGLSALVLQFVTLHGFQGLMVITVIAGVLQIVLGTLRLGRTIQLIPKTVIEGVLSAIGFIIVLGQLHILAGKSIPGAPLKSLQELPNTFAAAIGHISASNPAFMALAVGLFAISLQVIWRNWIPAKLKFIPAALPAIIIATLVSWDLEIPKVVLQNLGSYTTESLATFAAAISGSQWFHLIPAAIGLALVASAESLITAKATDILAQKHHVKSGLAINRELFAQGVGNLVSGALGGLPVSGVMVRSAANVESGGRTRLATMLHGVWVIGFILFLPSIVAKMPSAALAAVLILIGIKLINAKHMLQAVQSNLREAYLWPATALAIMTTDLLTGLLIGVGLAVADNIYKTLNSKLRA